MDINRNELQTCNEFLEAFTTFVYQKGQFVKLPDNERGHFFEKEAYVFLCIYNSTQTQFDALYLKGASSDQVPKLFPSDNESISSEIEPLTLNCVVYFCQSKKTSKVPYSNFQLSTLKEMQDLVKQMYKCNVNVELVEFGHEPFALLAHLENNYVLHNCTRAQFRQSKTKIIDCTKLYQVRVDLRYRTTRVIEKQLGDPFITRDCMYIFKISSDPFMESPKKYLWKGEEFPNEELETVLNMIKQFKTNFGGTIRFANKIRN